MTEKMDMAIKAVELKNIYFSYNNHIVLEDVSLSIAKNDFIAVIGPNGGGKTTLLKIILGILKPDRGTVKIFETQPKNGLRGIGYLAQKSSINMEYPLSVFETVLMGKYAGIGRRFSVNDHDDALKALQLVEMQHYKDAHIGALSGGQLQRVLIARSIVNNPGLLLLDEPLAGIDPEMQHSIYELLCRLNREMTIVLVTHDISAVSAYIEKVACLNKKLYYHGPKEGSLGKLEEAYKCPIELIAHGIPHRVLGRHK